MIDLQRTKIAEKKKKKTETSREFLRNVFSKKIDNFYLVSPVLLLF